MENNSIGFDYSELIAFKGYLLDKENLLKSSSGGAARAIIETIIKKNGIVFGVEYTEDFYSARYCYIEELSQVDRIVGSKYIYTDKKVKYDNEFINVYELVGNFLKENRIVLFIGLGCDVAAVKKYCEINDICTTQLFLVDLICQGPTLPCIQEMYIKNLERKYNAKAVNFSVRYKKYGWTPPHIRVVFDNGKKFEESLYGSDFGFALSRYSKECCYNCQNKGENHKSDLTLGDYWGIEKKDDGYNANGVSILLVKTFKAQELVNQIDASQFVFSKADIEKALLNNPMYYTSREKYYNQDLFEKNVNELGLHQAVVKEIGKFNYYKIKILRIINKLVRDICRQRW